MHHHDGPIHYFNGNFCTLDEVRIHPFDRGFLFGEGVYEVVSVAAGRYFLPRLHSRRLMHALSCLGVSLPDFKTEEAWISVWEALLERNAIAEGSLYVHVTRGQAPWRDKTVLQGPSTVWCFFQKSAAPQKHSAQSQGVIACLEEDRRPPHHDMKNTSRLDSLMLYDEAVSQSCYETILVKDYCMTEGTSSNVFLVKDDCVLTPPSSPFVLSGVMRHVVRYLCHSLCIPFKESMLTVEDLKNADAVWLTGSQKGIVAVDGVKVGALIPGGGVVRFSSSGALFRKIQAGYVALKECVSSEEKMLTFLHADEPTIKT